MKPLREFLHHEWAVLRKRTHDLEFDPDTQWRFHRRMAWFWLLNTPFVLALLIFDVAASFGTFPPMAALLITAVMLSVNTVYSLWANFATEFDAVSAADAARRAKQIETTDHAEL